MYSYDMNQPSMVCKTCQHICLHPVVSCICVKLAGHRKLSISAAAVCTCVIASCVAQADLEQDLRGAREAVNKAEELAGMPLTVFDSPGARSSRCACITPCA
jgi:hypothetical protein